MTFDEALKAEVEEHVEKHGLASLWATDGVYEALAGDPSWANPATVRMETANAEEEEDEEEERVYRIEAVYYVAAVSEQDAQFLLHHKLEGLDNLGTLPGFVCIENDTVEDVTDEVEEPRVLRADEAEETSE